MCRRNLEIDDISVPLVIVIIASLFVFLLCFIVYQNCHESTVYAPLCQTKECVFGQAYAQIQHTYSQCQEMAIEYDDKVDPSKLEACQAVYKSQVDLLNQSK